MSHPTLITVTSTQIYNELMQNISINSISTITWQKKNHISFSRYDNNPYYVTPNNINNIINSLNNSQNIVSSNILTLNYNITSATYFYIDNYIKNTELVSACAYVSSFEINTNLSSGNKISQKQIQQNLSTLYPLIYSQLSENITNISCYIDNTNGNDNNNGFFIDKPLKTLSACLNNISKWYLSNNLSIKIILLSNYDQEIVQNYHENKGFIFKFFNKQCTLKNNTKIIFKSDINKKYTLAFTGLENDINKKPLSLFLLNNYIIFENITISTSFSNIIGTTIENDAYVQFSNVTISGPKYGIKIDTYSTFIISNNIQINTSDQTNSIGIQTLNNSILMLKPSFSCIISGYNIGISILYQSLLNYNYSNISELSPSYIEFNNISRYYIECDYLSQVNTILPATSGGTYNYGNYINNEIPTISQSILSSTGTHTIYSTYLKYKDSNNNLLNLQTSNETILKEKLTNKIYNNIKNYKNNSQLSKLSNNTNMNGQSIFYINCINNNNTNIKLCNIDKLETNNHYNLFQ